MVDMKKSEMGQALVLIVIGIVGLLGFAALAIDGGRVYIDRRSMQNASDTGSFAGGLEYTQYLESNGIHYDGGWNCAAIQAAVESQAKNAAIDRTESNGYIVDTTVDESSGDVNGVRTRCMNEDYGGFVDKYIEIETYVTSVTPSSLAQFVFGGPLEQTVYSTSRIHPQTTVGLGAAIVALNREGCEGNQNGVQLDGNSDIYVNGGGIISNGCLGKNGNGDVQVSEGNISWGGDPSDYTKVGPGDVTPDPEQNSGEIPEYSVSIPPPNCTGMTNHGNANSGGSLSPGIYNNIQTGSNEAAILAPGLYCITNDFTTNGQAYVFGENVTIYVINGNFTTNGGAEVILTAPTPDSIPNPAPVNSPIQGVVIYLAQENTGEVVLLGNENSQYQGTVYAPDGTIEAGGASSLVSILNTQLIGWDVFVHGDATIDIINDDSIDYQVPPNISLQK